MASTVEALRYAVGKLNDGDFAEVQRIGHEVLSLEPQNADAMHLLGLAARKQEQPVAAGDWFRRAIGVRPDKAAYQFELGICLRAEGDVAGALACYQRALELEPKLHAAQVNAGAALDDLGRSGEALEAYQRALELKPDCVNSYANLGNSLQTLGRLEASIAAYRRALAIDASVASTHWNYAMALLRGGHFSEGWEEYEWRSAANETKLDLYPQPAWDGSSLAGKTLLVHAEQGIGDEILFASCYPDLIRQAEHCVFICEPRLSGLFARSFPEATVIGYRRKHERTPCDVARTIDYQIPAGSVPRILRPGAEHFPTNVHYLRPDPGRVQMWRERFAALGPGKKIGISWRAGGKPSEQVRRTTELALWRPLFDLPGVQFVNLQYGQAAEDLELLKQWGYAIHDWDDADALTDLEGLAAMITALDLVISVGNTTVHLAGGLGAPAWSLVAANPSWRWMDTGDRVPWYSSVRLFRQQRGEPWQNVFDALHRELCQHFGLHRSERAPPRVYEEALERPSPSQQELDPIATLRIPANVSGMKFVAKLTETIEAAIKHHQGGELDKAEALYRDVLKNTPQHPDALHLLGVVCQQTRRTREAIKLIRQAIALNDTIASFHYHLGLTLKDAGQAEGAIASYRRSLELNPDSSDARISLGVALQELCRFTEAVDCYEQSLANGAATPGILVNLGAALRGLGRGDEARQRLEQALEQQPAFPEARVQLGLLAQEQRQLQEALQQFQRALADNPNHAAAFRCLGKTHLERQCWDEAILCFQRALELKPRDYESAANLGVAFEQQEQFALAVDAFRQALTIQPHLQTHLRLINALRHLGRLADALAECDKLLVGEAECVPVHCTRAQILLQQGDLPRGCWEYSWRWQGPGQSAPLVDGVARWEGGALAGKRLLVHGDAALNDMLLFSACLPEVVTRAEATTITCDSRLAALFARTFPDASVQPIDAPLPRADVQVALTELPLILGYQSAELQRARRALVADSPCLAESRQWLSGLSNLPRVGILWRCRHKANLLAGTSRAPALEHWQPLLQTAGAKFIGLLPEANEQELASLSGADGLPLWPATEDLDVLAGQLAALDLVITIDDFIAHLAASLGKPVWLVLPMAWGWQWPLGQTTTPWYASVRLFRPKRLQAWPELMTRMQAELSQWIADRTGGHPQPNPPHMRSMSPGRTAGSMLTMKHEL